VFQYNSSFTKASLLISPPIAPKMMFGKFIRRNGKRGLTGIETAIILVAFVIVAASFAFAVLNVGFQSTQKAQDVMRGGMEQASSAMEIDGGVVGYASQYGSLDQLNFTIRLSPGRTPIDLHKDYFVITVTTSSGSFTDVYVGVLGDGTGYDGTPDQCVASAGEIVACTIPVRDKGAIGFMEHGDKFLVVVKFGDGVKPGSNELITLELKPSIGNVLTIQRQTPLVVSGVMFFG